jgi:hypothetical protein
MPIDGGTNPVKRTKSRAETHAKQQYQEETT